MSTDASLEKASRLIAEVGTCYSRGRRYRALARECEERYLARALAIGSEVRQRARRLRHDDAAGPAALRELGRLLRECAAAIARVRAGREYQAAVQAWDERRWHDVAALAPELFDAVVCDRTECPLFAPVGVTSRRGGEHFLAPAVVAERIVELAASGLPAADPTPELGADERIGAVFLEDDPEATGSPIILVIAPEQVALPRFRLEPAGEVLIYTPRLETEPGVRWAPTVSDEWWAVRPEAYAEYTAELGRELAQRGFVNVGPL